MSAPGHFETPPGDRQEPRRFVPSFHWELLVCGLRGHRLLGTDARELRPQDASSPAQRRRRCAGTAACAATAGSRCRRPTQPTREFPPERDEVEVPLRGRALRDKIVLRVIAVDRALHFVLLLGARGRDPGLLGQPRRSCASRCSTCSPTSRTGSAGGVRGGGLIGDLRKLFSVAVGDADQDRARRRRLRGRRGRRGVRPVVAEALGRVPHLRRHHGAAAARGLRADPAPVAAQDRHDRDQPRGRRVPAVRQAAVRPARRRRRPRSANASATRAGPRSSARPPAV